MSFNPFQANAEIRFRCEDLSSRIGSAFQKAALERLNENRSDPERGLVLSPVDQQALKDDFEIRSTDELMLQLLPVARTFAHPPLSNFYVGVVGLEADTGNLLIGFNVEFPGTSMALTLHGETFLAARIFSRGTKLEAIALGEAHPCAHCRQFLSEFSGAHDLKLIDLLGHVLKLGQLYPWPFDPDYLGETGIIGGAIRQPDLKLSGAGLASDLLAALITAGQRAYAPYSDVIAACALVLNNGRVITGSSIESVSFNPSMGPFQAAIANLFAYGFNGADIADVVLVQSADGQMDHAPLSQQLALKFAPQARFQTLFWEP